MRGFGIMVIVLAFAFVVWVLSELMPIIEQVTQIF